MSQQLIAEVSFSKDSENPTNKLNQLKAEILEILKQEGLNVAKEFSPSNSDFIYYLGLEAPSSFRIWLQNSNRVSIDVLLPNSRLENLKKIRSQIENRFSTSFKTDSINTFLLPRGIDLLAVNDNPESLLILKNPRILQKEKTPYQELVVVDSNTFLGRSLSLDEKLQISTFAVDNYTPALTDPILELASSGKQIKVLVIGAGDGRIMKYLLKKGGESVLSVDIVEIDRRVIEVCEQYFEETTSWQKDPRVHVYIEDAVQWIAQEKNLDEYDAAIIDCTDADVPPSLELFSVSFYQQLARKLKKGAVFTQQCDVIEAYANLTRKKLSDAGWSQVEISLVLTPEYMGNTFLCRARKV